MSVERPESISRPVTLLARAASLAMGVAAIGLAMTATPGIPFLASSMSSAVLTGATALTGWMMTNKAVEARNYNEGRLSAIKEAERTGTAPHLPKNPFLDPKKQPSPFLTKAARYLAGAVMITGMVATLAFFGDPVGLMQQLGGPLVVAPTAIIGGATLLKMASVAESTRRFAEYEVSHHANYKDDLELTHTQEVEPQQAKAASYQFETTQEPPRKSFVEALFEERGLEQGTRQER